MRGIVAGRASRLCARAGDRWARGQRAHDIRPICSAPRAARDLTLYLVGSAWLLCALSSALAGDPSDRDVARQQFLTSCGTCHSADAGGPDRQGPNLFGVLGRRAGSRPDFAYSVALKGGRWIWDEAAIDRFITNAQEAHPGTFMTYAQSDPEKRARILAFLKSEAAGAAAADKR